MRGLMWIALIAGLLWGGYWVVGSFALKRSTDAWFAAQAAQGFTAHNDGVAVRGFPNRFDLTVTGLSFADPNSGYGWAAPFVQVFSMTWKPWHLIAALPDRQVITTPDQELSLTAQGLRGSLRLRPGRDLALQETVGEGSALLLESSQGWTIAADRAVISTVLDASRANAHRIGLSISNLTPDQGVMLALAGQSDQPDKIEDVHLDGFALFSAPLDRHAGKTKPTLTGIELTEFRLLWGGLRFYASGNLIAGPQGLAEGEIALRIEGWRRLAPVLAALGLVKPQVAVTIESTLQTMADQGSDPKILNVSLTMANGRMWLGPVQLGAAPQLNWQLWL